MTLFLLLGCAPPRWTPESALAPHRAALDADRNGVVDAAEFERPRWEGPPFASADADGDGDLSTAELLALFRAQSPTGFDGGTPPEDARPGGQPWQVPTREQDVWEVLVWMGDALRSDGDAGADPALVDAAVQSGSLESPESRVALASMQSAWETNGWPWPEGLPRTDSPPTPATGGSDPSSIVSLRVQAELTARRARHRAPSASPPSSAAPGAQ